MVQLKNKTLSGICKIGFVFFVYVIVCDLLAWITLNVREIQNIFFLCISFYFIFQIENGYCKIYHLFYLNLFSFYHIFVFNNWRYFLIQSCFEVLIFKFSCFYNLSVFQFFNSLLFIASGCFGFQDFQFFVILDTIPFICLRCSVLSFLEIQMFSLFYFKFSSFSNFSKTHLIGFQFYS